MIPVLWDSPDSLSCLQLQRQGIHCSLLEYYCTVAVTRLHCGNLSWESFPGLTQIPKGKYSVLQTEKETRLQHSLGLAGEVWGGVNQNEIQGLREAQGWGMRMAEPVRHGGEWWLLNSLQLPAAVASSSTCRLALPTFLL